MLLKEGKMKPKHKCICCCKELEFIMGNQVFCNSCSIYHKRLLQFLHSKNKRIRKLEHRIFLLTGGLRIKSNQMPKIEKEVKG